MITTLFVGLAVSGALVIGAAVGAFSNPPQRLVAVMLGFACGALITALAFDMFQPAFAAVGIPLAGTALMAGAVLFVTVQELINRYGGSKSTLISTIADGTPESLALGAALAGNTALSIIAFALSTLMSNLPESLGGAVDMKRRGRSEGFIVAAWTTIALGLAGVVFFSNLLFREVDESLLASIRAFAGGAVLASVASTMMPQAYRNGGPFVAIATAAGFLLAFSLSQLF